MLSMQEWFELFVATVQYTSLFMVALFIFFAGLALIIEAFDRLYEKKK